MGGGGGSQRQTGSTTPMFPPQLSGALGAFGNLATQVFQNFGPELQNFMADQTPQQVAGPTGIEDLAYLTQSGMLQSQGPQAWSDALGMYNSLGNLDPWQGVDWGNIGGWGVTGPQAQAQAANQPAPSPGEMFSNPALAMTAQKMASSMPSSIGDDGLEDPYSEPGAGGVGVANPYQSSGTADPRAASMGLDPTQPGSSAQGDVNVTPGGGVAPPYTQANPNAGGINSQTLFGGPAGGQVREVDIQKYIGGGGGGGGGGGFSFNASSGGDVEGVDRIENVLDKIDFANHPALQSALKTFAATSLPGIENAMIGAGLGRSGAAGNAIATGKAQLALPVMQQLIQGELEQRGQNVTQRGQDIQANIAARNAAASAAASGASLQQQRMLAGLAAEQAMRAQDIQLRGQDINALLQNAGMGLEARGQDINALISGAGGLTNLGQQDISRIMGNIQGGMNIGDTYRGIQNDIYSSEFAAQNRPYERIMDFMQPLMGTFASPGQRTESITTGGGK